MEGGTEGGKDRRERERDRDLSYTGLLPPIMVKAVVRSN